MAMARVRSVFKCADKVTHQLVRRDPSSDGCTSHQYTLHALAWQRADEV